MTGPKPSGPSHPTPTHPPKASGADGAAHVPPAAPDTTRPDTRGEEPTSGLAAAAPVAAGGSPAGPPARGADDTFTACGYPTPDGPCDLRSQHPAWPGLPGFGGHMAAERHDSSDRSGDDEWPLAEAPRWNSAAPGRSVDSPRLPVWPGTTALAESIAAAARAGDTTPPCRCLMCRPRLSG